MMVRMITERIRKGGLFLTTLTFSAMLLAIIVQVVFRYAFNRPISWIEELARYLFIWCVYSGAMVVYMDGEFTRSTFLQTSLPRRLSEPLEILIKVFSFLVFVYVLYYSAQVALFDRKPMMSLSLDLPLTYIYLSVFVCSFFTSAYTVLDLCQTIGRLANAGRKQPK